MIIEKVELENFMCYSGKSSMEFKEGINVIIGDNGYGKSKLYDAFYWVLYDQVFVSEKKEFQSTRAVKSSIISDKAKVEATDGKLSTTVSITFHNMERDDVYILERKYTVKVNNGEFTEPNESEFTIMKRDLSYLNAKMVNDEEEKKKIVSKILPPQIKDYLWFQGEQVESIIDFNQQDTLTKAIKVLSNITRYDDIKEISHAVAKSGNNEYLREVKRLSKDKGKSDDLEIDKKRFEDKLEGLYEDEKEVKDNLSRAEERCDELLSKLSDATKVSELSQRKKNIIRQLEELNDSLKDEQTSFHRKMFRNKWVLKGTHSLHISYSEKFSEYENEKLKRAAEARARIDAEDKIAKVLQTRLPLDVPEPIYVKRMLDEEKCLVCDREAKKGSDSWKKIKELIDRPKSKLESEILEPKTKHDFSDDFKRLYQNGLVLTHRIDEIDEDITDTLKKISTINSKIRSVNEEMKKVEEETQKLISDTSQTVESSENIVGEHSIQNQYAVDFRENLNKTRQNIDFNKSNLKRVEEQLSDLVTGEIPKWLIEKKNVLIDFELIATSTRDRVFNSLILQLEKEANTHYKEMTEGNMSARGKIRLKKLPNGNYMPEIINDKGIPLRGSNTSNLILVKLATIMAILSAKSNDGFVNFYTLITDAPTSVFGEDYTIGFCQTISKVYRQSIIMSKEFYKNKELRNELMANKKMKIGKVYMISPSIPEKNRTNRDNLSTKIEPLN